MISVPAGVTSVEKRAVRDAALKAGAREAYLIEEPLAAAIGANVPISGPSGNMIIDIGGGTQRDRGHRARRHRRLAQSLRVGGNKFDESIATYIRKKYNLMIGERTAEEVKIQIGTALPLERELTMEVRGRDLIAGLPRTIPITSSEVMEAIEAPLQQLVAAVRSVLEQTPPELSSDIIDKGMVMSGGGALLRNIDKLLTQVTGVPVPRRREPAGLRRPGHRPGAGALRLLQEVARPADLSGADSCAPARASSICTVTPIGVVRLACRSPPRVVRAAATRGLTHLAITDHDRIDGALAAARRRRRPGLTSSSARRSRRADGDLICVFLERADPARAVAPSRPSPRCAQQGGLVGHPAPVRPAARLAAAGREDGGARRARRLGRGPQRPARRQRQRAGGRVRRASTDCPAWPSPTRTPSLEVGVAYTRARRRPVDAGRAARGAADRRELVPGRATYFVRLVDAVAKLVQRTRGNGRIQPRRSSGRPTGGP